MNIWKKLLLVNSIVWVFAATFCVYAVTYGIISFDWDRFIYGLLVLGFFSLTQVAIAIAGD